MDHKASEVVRCDIVKLGIGEDFEYVRGPMTAMLKSGGDVGVTVAQSQFVTATLDVDADVVPEADHRPVFGLQPGGLSVGSGEELHRDAR